MKFINLLKKELSELINAQMILSLAFTLIVFLVMGNVMQSVTEELNDDIKNPKINICDMDETEFTKDMLDSFRSDKVDLNMISVSGDDYAAAFKNDDFKSFIIIPKGFTDTVSEGKKPEIISVSKVKSASAFSNITGGTETTESLINVFVSKIIAEQQGVSNDELLIIEAPLTITPHTVIADKSAPVSGNSIIQKIVTQNIILPIIVFMLLLLTSQSLISSISNEKIDKTLETLLSAPVSRGSIITAKMLAAAIVALLNAAVMMIGFSAYSKGMTGAIASDMGASAAASLSTGDAFRQLGINLGIADYALIGIQLFLTIMICLAISIILGALVNDTKSSQTMLMPILILVMIPWLVSMFADINSLPAAPKLIVYAIPFTHTFSAMQNLMFGNMTEFWIGLAYQAVVFTVVMFFALKLFKSDKILTISLNFGQKSRFRKTTKTNED